MKGLPRVTQGLMQKMAADAKKGTYRVTISNILIDVFPYVFPPRSAFSESSKTLYEAIGAVEGKLVLDMGTGTGIQAIVAAKAGASHVDAADICPEAVACARHNAQLNGLEHKITVYESNLFSSIPAKQYDTIIANLPIMDYPEKNIKMHSLFDPGLRHHEQLFQESSAHLADQGAIMLTHADLDGKDAFERLESLGFKYGYRFSIQKQISALGHQWRTYEFRRGKL
ncbi:methyltransferase domain-containing protein [Candidatus Woesearchaeota archaeon]|nr:MAG: methyltransferase domain-containing protein [Candidatus Woesearchaeota archaeon]